MIAIGGSIGTGLFLAMGGTIRDVDPGGAMVGYAIMGIAGYCMMTELGEMATEYPVLGAFTAYVNRFVDKAWGFTNGWSYWFGSSMTVAAELIAGAIVVKYWFPGTNSALWAALFRVVLLALNLFSVKGFGEAEFWFAGIKVVVTIIFLIFNECRYPDVRISCGNSSMYTASIAATAFVASMLGDGVACTAAYYLCGIAGVYNWLTISAAHYRFHKGWVAQGHSLSELEYRSPFYPWGSWLCIIVCVVVCFGANWWVFTDFNWFDFLTCYEIIPIFIIMFFA